MTHRELLRPWHPSLTVWRLVLALLLALVVLRLLAPATAQSDLLQTPVVLHDNQPQVDAWPQVRLLYDPGKSLDLAQAMRQAATFVTPSTAARTLGIREDAVWLRIPVSVSPDSNGIWVLGIDYPVLNQIDVHVVTAGQVVATGRMGNLVPRSERMVDGRAPAMGLTLTPGTDYEIYLRVQNAGAMILPISLSKPPDYLHRALAEQMLQGVLLGVGLCLVVYSLVQWMMLNELLFAKYVLLVSGSILFSLLQFGVGAQFLWPGNAWIELHMGGLSALIAATGSFLFIEQVLRGTDMTAWLSRLMKMGAVLTSTAALLYAVDLISVSQVATIVSVLGLAPALLGLPGALRRARRGDQIGHSFLLAWAVYLVGTWVMIEVIMGRMEANFWTLHSFQFSATADMLIFLRVLGLQTRALKIAAQAARIERDNLHSMAHTDPLTGLPNRRVLDSAVASAIRQRRPDELVAVYMLDLDGFKQINDQFGHDTGDAVLVEVARRLKANLRSSDVITRLGGDEFLVLSSGLKSEIQVRELGEKLVKAIGEPMQIAGRDCPVGLTAGYGIAPDDGMDAAALIRKADAAMYAGKKDGKGRVGRAEAPPLAV